MFIQDSHTTSVHYDMYMYIHICTICMCRYILLQQQSFGHYTGTVHIHYLTVHMYVCMYVIVVDTPIS